MIFIAICVLHQFGVQGDTQQKVNTWRQCATLLIYQQRRDQSENTMRSNRDTPHDTQDDYRVRVAILSLKKCSYKGWIQWMNSMEEYTGTWNQFESWTYIIIWSQHYQCCKLFSTRLQVKVWRFDCSRTCVQSNDVEWNSTMWSWWSR